MTVQEWLGSENQLGQDIWQKKYCNDNESFDEWIERVSGGDEQIAKYIREKKFLFGGRILSNRGLHDKGRKITYSNCYVMEPPEDDLESIFDCAKKLARTYSYGGGCGVDISKLSPKGAKINNAAKETSGAVSFMDLYSMVTALIGQNGRRGALMISMDCSHPDIEDFITIKTDLDRVTKANISVRLRTDFMEAVKQGVPYTLSYTREATGETITKEVDARELFQKIADINWGYAEPGALFWDRIEGWNLMSNTRYFSYAGVNPCVTGETEILTIDGYRQIKDLVDQKVTIWNGYEWSEVEPHITGRNQKMVRIDFSDGSSLDCTLYHKFILKGDIRTEAKDLNVGDKLQKHQFPIIAMGKFVDEKVAYTQGFFMGDGSEHTDRKRLNIALYGEKRNCKPYLDYVDCYDCPSGKEKEDIILPYDPERYNKNFVPDTTYSIQSRLDWLAGYLDSDGSINSEEGSLSISSVNRDVLMKVKFMLNTLGCHASVIKMHDEGMKPMPKNDGTGDSKDYLYQTSYRLLISAANVEKLLGLGLNMHRLNPNPHVNRDAARFITVVAITPIEDCETVYCFTEPKNHSGIFNGVMTAQCAEEPLPAGGSCLLGSINLSAFVKEPFTEQASFDEKEFKRCVTISVGALNDVLEEGLPLHPLKEQQESVDDWRQIGLGIMGLADTLLMMGLSYGSKESLEFCDRIGFLMADTAIYASACIADKKGYFEYCNKYEIRETPYFQENTTPETWEAVDKYGIRNSQLLTIAPTGTLSTMLGISGGIEPIYANFYERKTESLHGKDVYYKVYTPIVKQYMKAHGIEDETGLPPYFVTAMTLDYRKRIAMQATWQKHIDASISSTVNVPNDFTKEQTFDLYMMAYENGLKGITIFRDGCSRAGVLSTKKEESASEQAENTLKRGDVVSVNDNVVGKKRKLVTGCGSLHCLAYFDPVNGNLQEIYLSKGSTGGCNNFMVGLSRMISISARAGVSMEAIVDQLNSSGSCPSYASRRVSKGDTSKGSCCPTAVGNALIEMYEEMQRDLGNKNASEKSDQPNQNQDKLSEPSDRGCCPECGEPLVFEEGCNICKNCGWSKCH